MSADNFTVFGNKENHVKVSKNFSEIPFRLDFRSKPPCHFLTKAFDILIKFLLLPDHHPVT